MGTDERMKVMKLVQDGKITAEEGDELIQLLEAQSQPKNPGPVKSAQTTEKARWMKVRVTNLDTGKVVVNVRLPLGLVNAGMKIGSRFTPEMDDIDLEALLQAARQGETGEIVDVYDEEDRERVEVILE